MDKLIKALQIFLKYGNPDYPTHCEHDQLYIVGYDWNEITDEDRRTLDELGFIYDEDDESIYSFRYGSA